MTDGECEPMYKEEGDIDFDNEHDSSHEVTRMRNHLNEDAHSLYEDNHSIVP